MYGIINIKNLELKIGQNVNTVKVVNFGISVYDDLYIHGILMKISKIFAHMKKFII
jgi:hypothetical protein